MTQVLIDRAALELVLRTALAQQGDTVAYSQFLTDVVTAAGLLEHGRRDKGLAQRIADYAFSARSNLYTAAPAPQPAQGVPEVGFGNMPYSPYLFGGLRFKMNFDKSGNATNFHGVESSLQGAWVALVDATDNRHLQSAQPVAPPLTLEQILDIVKKLDETPDMSHVDVLKTFARAIEAAHGIREVK